MSEYERSASKPGATSGSSLRALVTSAKACTLCEADLPLGPRPLFQLHADARILIAGQAPGRKAHISGVPFDDASGDRLREWMDIDREIFYDARQIALLPMGFCYPGRGASGDLAPRRECAPSWRQSLLERLREVKLTIAIGQYAIRYHLPASKRSLTETVRSWRSHWPNLVPLPHPSPRNQAWLKRNPWLERELLPKLRQRVAEILVP